MDLREISQGNSERHPWELARASALKKILSTHASFSHIEKVLDIGCGDGYLVNALLNDISVSCVDAVDICLSPSEMHNFSQACPHIHFHNSYEGLKQDGYSLISMFDVLEHVEDDVAFLTDVNTRFAATDASLFISVPAYNSLFANHDRYLKHFRRYSREQLADVVKEAGLEIIASGYLFFLLLPLRGLAVMGEKIFGHSQQEFNGVGKWQYGPNVTMAVKIILEADNTLSLWLNRIGIKIPGLTAWALCKKSL